MASFRARQPRAGVPFCWLCDRRLYAGGRFYATVTGEDGREHPAHTSCAKEAAVPVKHHAVESVPEKDAAYSFLPEARPLKGSR